MKDAGGVLFGVKYIYIFFQEQNRLQNMQHILFAIQISLM